MEAVRRQYTAQEKCEIVLDVGELGVFLRYAQFLVIGDARIRVVRKPGSIGTYYALASRTGRETVRRPRARSRGPCLRRIGFSPGRRS
jgi:hypothetical protein